jgi:hypothetical protein
MVGSLVAVQPAVGKEPRKSRWWDTSRDVSVLDSSPLRHTIEEVPDDSTLEARGASIGEIYIQRNNVFDPSHPAEDQFIFNTANKLHIRTREGVVEQKLLFQTGDPYSRRILEETERYLRSVDYLYDAWIGPIRVRDNAVDILVITRDVWTLGLGAGFERSGGENTLTLEVQDSNFLGTGRFLTLKYEDTPDRSSYRFRYQDPAVLGSRLEFRLLFADNSDGYRRTLDLERPFFSLDTRWSAGARWVNDDRITKIYQLGEVAQVFRDRVQSYEVRGGLSHGYSAGGTNRLTFGYTYDKHQFERDPDEDPVPGRPTPQWFDRIISFPWVGFERISDRYVETRNLDQMNRTEDLNLGAEIRAHLGYSSTSLGADTDQVILGADVHLGASRNPDELLLLDIGGKGRWGSETSEGVLTGVQLQYYRRNFEHFQFYGMVKADAAWNPDRETQLLLGGDTGLRGYPRNYQSGDRRFLVTLEQRYYSDIHLFRLFYLGGAAFLDFGRAWHDHGRYAGADEGVLRDVGIGLRLSSSRSSQGKMIHLDVAFPLDGDSNGVQWLVTSRESF